jgi:formylglycine-generating enzyme required for sulfatase activity
MYSKDSDPGLHASAEWLLRTWKQEEWLKKVNDQWAADKGHREKREQEIKKLLASRAATAPGVPSQWYVNGQGQTMVVFPGPVEFLMGSPLTEKDRSSDELQHKQRIGRTFALATAPVTREQFFRFQPSFSHYELMPYSYPTRPIGVTWYEAAAYCNWLSQQEGIPEDQWCYEIPDEPGGFMAWRFASMKLKPNYLSLTGYRLPTEAEWEYACRAGAATSRCYGETVELLPHYHPSGLAPESRQTQPVGTKKPNDWGLFDMHGNFLNWCQERYKLYATTKQGKPIDDIEDSLSIISTVTRVLRGGSFSPNGMHVRSANRVGRVPNFRDSLAGIRPARTFTP